MRSAGRTGAHVLVVSRHELVRAGVLAVLGGMPDLDVRAARPTPAALTWADVALYDALGLGLSPGELGLLVNQPRLRVLVLTHDLRPDLADQALITGADGCVSLTWPATRVVHGVRAAVRGRLRGDGSATSFDYTGKPGNARTDLPLLSRRELQVLRLIASGRSNAEIAAELFLSINSVKTYIRGAYQKIDVQSRSQAVVWCLRHGLSGELPDSDVG